MSHERALQRRPIPDDRPGRDATPPLAVGDDVEVFSGYERTWSAGFSVARVLRGSRFRLRRAIDGALLPDPTGAADVRPLRHPDAR
jgi:hypothetical protein